jgi:hypothetical protein
MTRVGQPWAPPAWWGRQDRGAGELNCPPRPGGAGDWPSLGPASLSRQWWGFGVRIFRSMAGVGVGLQLHQACTQPDVSRSDVHSHRGDGTTAMGQASNELPLSQLLPRSPEPPVHLHACASSCTGSHPFCSRPCREAPQTTQPQCQGREGPGVSQMTQRGSLGSSTLQELELQAHWSPGLSQVPQQCRGKVVPCHSLGVIRSWEQGWPSSCLLGLAYSVLSRSHLAPCWWADLRFWGTYNPQETLSGPGLPTSLQSQAGGHKEAFSGLARSHPDWTSSV